METFGNLLETVPSPAVAQGDSDRDRLRPSPPWDAIQVANQFREEIVREQFGDDQLQERAGPGECARASGEEPHRSRAHFVAPSVGVELVLRSRRLFEVVVDVDDDGTDLAHGQSSRATAREESSGVPALCGGPGPTAVTVCR